MGQNGGARPGAGRKPKKDRHERICKEAETLIAAGIPQYVANMMALASGVKVQNAKGDIYSTVPDRQANEYLINRIMGKPQERVDTTSAGEAIKPITVIQVHSVEEAE